MLKKLGLRKLAVTTSALFIIGLIYLFPSNNEELKIEKNITYIEPDEIYEVYLVDQNDYVSMVTLPLDSTELIDILKEKIEYLIIDGKKQEEVPNGFKPIIPEGTEILDLKVEENTATINFNENIKNIRQEDEEKMIEAIVYTLTNESNINKVYIKINGETLERLPNSNKLLPIPLDRGYGINKFYDFNSLYGLTKTTIYYVSNNGDLTYYIPVTKVTNDDREKITVIIDELKSNVIYQSNLSSYLNANAELEEYEIIEDAMHLSFNDKIFDSLINQNILEEVEYSISLSVKDNYDVSEVIFYVNDNLIMN